MDVYQELLPIYQHSHIFQLNVLMSRINLAWNGFGMDGAKALGDALKVNSALIELNIPYVFYLVSIETITNDMISPQIELGCYHKYR